MRRAKLMLILNCGLISVLCLALGCAGAPDAPFRLTGGPVTSAAEFFTEHLDTTIPELASIPEKVTSGDLVGAEKVFADYLRATLNPERYNRVWIGKAYPAEARDRLFRLAERTMSYHLDSASKNHHQYPIGSVDWKLNPTFNKQKEYVFVLSRHAFLTDLAEYYTLTGDERAANVYTNMISSWIDQAKAPPAGTNQYKTDCWRTIECGIRMGAWSRQIHAFLRSPAVTDRFLTDFFISVWEHGRRLRERPTHGNWFLIEMTGLVRIGLTYPFLKDAKPWFEYAMGRLENEFAIQVYPDGFQYELSTNYQGTCLECFNAIRGTFTDNGLEAPDFLAKGMRRMYEVYWKLSQPSRVTPDLNDGGRRDVAANCAAALRLYPEDPVFRWFATSGEEGAQPDVLSLAFPYAGAVVFRDSWSTNAIWGYLDASPFGRDHQHEDKLNFLLSAYGKDMVVEPGNYFYDTSEMRKYVLSTFAHNTVLIDGKGQRSRKGYQWRDEDIRKKADLDFSTARARDSATSAFTAGYGENAEVRVHHARTVLFLKDIPGTTPFFVVIDRLKDLDGSAPRGYEQVWHLEDCNLQIEGRSFRADFGDGVGLFSVCSDEQSAIADCRGQKDPVWQGWMPIRRRGPHEHRPIPTPVIRGTFSGARRVVTVLYPYGGSSCPLIGVDASSDVRDGMFCIRMADGRNLLFEENAKE